MSASEFAFMSLGLLVGVLCGAALVEILRSRVTPRRQIRLTVTPDAVPRRRAATLAEDAFVLAGPEPAFGGPADRRRFERRSLQGALHRTDVRSPLGPAGAGDPGSSLPVSWLADGSRPGAAVGLGASLTFSAIGPGIGGGAIAIPIYREPDWTLAGLRRAATRTNGREIREQRMTAAAILERPAATNARTNPMPAMPTPTGVDASWSGASDPPPSDSAAGTGTDAADGTSPDAPGEGCTEARRTSDERCAVATLSRAQAQTAHDALRTAQRAYDDHHTHAEQASVAADPRAVRVAKEAAQQSFRDARAQASSREAVETAARDWLNEINRINRAAREAGATTQRERESATALVMTIERLTVEADAARISSEVADAACLAARQALADCQEAAAADRQQSAAADRAATAWPPVHSVGQGGGRAGSLEDESELEAAFTATGAGEPAILRLVRGDRATLGRVVAELAGDDPAERRRWQLAIANLVDSIVARSIEAASLTFPLEHPFWGSFSLAQNREIVAALSSLGYRFDGLGGWTDERVPSQRDLSLAVGYAGLDPMRIRPWPNEHEMRELFRDVAVAADEYLAEAAGGLTLGELVSLLGRRADGLADLWNEWGRVRPLLLAGG